MIYKYDFPPTIQLHSPVRFRNISVQHKLSPCCCTLGYSEDDWTQFQEKYCIQTVSSPAFSADIGLYLCRRSVFSSSNWESPVLGLKVNHTSTLHKRKQYSLAIIIISNLSKQAFHHEIIQADILLTVIKHTPFCSLISNSES